MAASRKRKQDDAPDVAVPNDSNEAPASQAGPSVPGPSDQAAPTDAPPVAKRGRGRPAGSKTKPPIPEGEQPAKRPRGRPPKTRTPAELAAIEAKRSLPRPKRGRPPKKKAATGGETVEETGIAVDEPATSGAGPSKGSAS